jgi:hypothetical protein
MPVDFFMRSATPAPTIAGAGNRLASQLRGVSPNNLTTTTTAGGTNIQVTATSGGQAVQWFTEPIAQAITISGTVTAVIRGSESALSVNAAPGVLIERCDNAGTVLSTIVPDSVVGAEYGTTQAERTANFTPTSTAMAVGERIKITIKVRNVGTMGAGSVITAVNGQFPASNGDTFIRFTEDIHTDELIEINQHQGGGTYGYN